MTFGDIVKEYFPDISDEDMEHLIWSDTGFPCFWRIPEDGNTPEECLRKQLMDLKRRSDGTTRTET